MNGETLRDQLIRHEALRYKPYKDTVGKLTIGVGRNLDDKGVSKAEAMLMLDNDIQDATNELRAVLPWTDTLDWPRKSVLINMTFNMGVKKLIEFKQTLAAIQAKNYDLAATGMLDSLWARQVGPRAQELAATMKTGVM